MIVVYITKTPRLRVHITNTPSHLQQTNSSTTASSQSFSNCLMKTLLVSMSANMSCEVLYVNLILPASIISQSYVNMLDSFVNVLIIGETYYGRLIVFMNDYFSNALV